VVPVRAEVRRARLGQARRGPRGVRNGERAVHLRLGERVADAPSEDDRRADAAAGHARSVLVLRADTVPPVSRAAHGACAARTAAARARRIVSRARGLMMMRRVLIALCSALVATVLIAAPGRAAQPPTGQPATGQPATGQSEFVPMKELPPSEQIPAAT